MGSSLGASQKGNLVVGCSWLVPQLSPEGDSFMEVQLRGLRSHPKRETYPWECGLGVLAVS